MVGRVGSEDVAQDFFDDVFGAAIGAGDVVAGGAGFGVGDGCRAVDRGRRAEDEAVYGVFIHGFQQRQGRADVGLVVEEGLFGRFTDCFEAGEMDDGVEFFFGEKFV